MTLKRSFAAACAAGVVLSTWILGLPQTRASAVKTGYAPVNGLNLYYEVYGAGAGEPLILLHGGLGSTEMFSELMPVLSHSRRVIAVDLQAHGRTADIARPLSVDSMADDIAALMKHLGIARADVLGYSLGGAVALRTVVRHPDIVRKLVLVSTAFKRDGWYPEITAAMAQMGAGAAEMMKQSPIYQVYSRIAPKPTDFPVLLNKIGELLRQDYDWSKDIAAIKSPTLLVFGDADAVRPDHIVQFFGLLGGGKRDGGWDGSGISNARLAVLPGMTHYNILSSPALAPAVTSFLETPGSQLK
jgi:pimeloyl-ACP methyl ester carboxylesterase